MYSPLFFTCFSLYSHFCHSYTSESLHVESLCSIPDTHANCSADFCDAWWPSRHIMVYLLLLALYDQRIF